MMSPRKTLLFFASLALGWGALPGPAPSAWAAALPKCRDLPRWDYSKDRDYREFSARSKRQRCVKPWTVLVYMAADNDLAPYAYSDLYEMEAGFKSGRPLAGSAPRSDLVVQLDTPGTGGIRRLHVFQTPEPYNPRLSRADFERRRESDVRSPVAGLVSERSGSARSESEKLQAFLEWGMKQYPSERYMVIVWGHGQGWAPAREAGSTAEKGPFQGRRFGGLAFNDRSGDFLDIPSLKRVLADVSRNLLDGRPIDVYASDACLMQMLEVATEISGAARFIVGSAQVQNFLGLPYRRLMHELNSGRFDGERGRTQSADEAYLLARMIPRIFRASLSEGGLQGRLAPEAIRTITLSALSSAELRQSLLPALGKLAKAMKAYLKEDELRGMDIQALLRGAPSYEGGAQELGSLLIQLKLWLEREAEKTGVETPGARELHVAAGRTHSALQRTVMSHALGTDYSDRERQHYLLGFRAVSVWIPASAEDYGLRFADFTGSAFYRLVPDWASWISSLY